MKQCVIFDMDGVIIDSEPIHQECERELFRMLGIKVTNDEHDCFIGTTDEVMWSKLGNMHTLPIKISEIIQLKKTLYLEYLKRETYLKPIPFVVELIADLYKKGFLLALASSSPHEQIKYILTAFGIQRYFHVNISGEDVKLGKPNPEIFILASELLRVSPELCVVIEDSYNGVTAAKNANMKCIGYKNPNSGKQDLSQSDLIVGSFNELSAGMIYDLLP